MRNARFKDHLGGVSARGVSAGGGGVVSAWGVSARVLYTPCEQNDWQAGAKTLPSCNFVCGRK